MAFLAVVLASTAPWGCSGSTARSGVSPGVDGGEDLDAGRAADAAANADSGEEDPDARPTGRLVHVSPGSDGRGADGSRDRPYPTIHAGIEAAAVGDVVFLLPGEYPAPGRPIEGPADLLGSGPDASRLLGPLELAGTGLRLRDVSLLGGEPAATITGEVTLEGIRIEGAVATGLAVEGAATLREVHVTGIQPKEEVPFPAGVRVADGRLVWSGGGASDTASSGVHAVGGTVVLTDLEFTRLDGFGVYADVAAVEMSGIRVEEALAAGIRVVECQSDLRDLRIDATVYDEGGLNTGNGLDLVSGEATVVGIETHGAALTGIRATNGARATIEGAVVHNAGVDGLSVQAESEVTVEGAEIRDTGSTGVVVIDAQLTLRDARVIGHRRQGMLSGRAGRLIGERVLVEDGETRGISILAGTAVFEDLTVRRAADVALSVSDASEPVTVEGGLFEDNASTGVAVTGREPVSLVGVTVRGTRRGPDGLADGVHVYRGSATLRDTRLEGNRATGLLVEGGEVQMTGGGLTDNDEPGVVLIESEAESTFDGVVASGNRGSGFLVIGSAARFVDVEATDSRTSPKDGTAEGLSAVLQSNLTVVGGRFHSNPGNGVQLFQGARAAFEDARFESNGQFGVVCGFGSQATFSGDNVFAGNTRGDTSGCAQ
jgi:hypothetical protein